jgi:serine protease Do
MDEMSAKGTPGETGVILLDVPETSAAGKAGFFDGDVILSIDGKPVRDIRDLVAASENKSPGESLSVTVLRFQQESTIKIQLK